MGTNVYLGRLSYAADERDIEDFFENYGKILDIDLKKGFAFVKFDNPKDADDAVYEMDGKKIRGERVLVEFAKGTVRGRGRDDRYNGGGGGGGGYGGRDSYRDNYRDSYRRRRPSKYPRPRTTEHRLTVENLSSRVSWQDLKDYMKKAGEVTYADAHKLNRNEGIVMFATRADMKNALRMFDNADINGRRIRLIEYKPNKDRSYSRSRSRSGSRSKSRSRSPKNSKSRSRSPTPKSGADSKSRSRSRSPDERARSRSKSRSASRSDDGQNN